MLSVKIDRRDRTELFEQVAVLGVNTNTVLRSLRLLRDEGFRPTL